MLYSRSEDRWKLADFGLTRVGTTHGLADTHAAWGTSGYRPPELLQEIHRFNKLSDIWSLGCILYALATGRPPFRNDSEVLNHYQDTQRLNTISSNHWDLNTASKLTDYIRMMMQKNPSSRPSASTLVILFESPTSTYDHYTPPPPVDYPTPPVNPPTPPIDPPTSPIHPPPQPVNPGPVRSYQFKEQVSQSMLETTHWTCRDAIVNRKNDRVATISFDEEGKQMRARLWNARGKLLWERVEYFPNHLQSHPSPAFSEDGNFLGIYANHRVTVMNVHEVRIVRTFNFPRHFVIKAISIGGPLGMRVTVVVTSSTGDIPSTLITEERSGLEASRIVSSYTSLYLETYSLENPSDPNGHVLVLRITDAMDEVAIAFTKNGGELVFTGSLRTLASRDNHWGCWDVPTRVLRSARIRTNNSWFLDGPLFTSTLERLKVGVFKVTWPGHFWESTVFVRILDGQLMDCFTGRNLACGISPTGSLLLLEDYALIQGRPQSMNPYPEGRNVGPDRRCLKEWDGNGLAVKIGNLVGNMLPTVSEIKAFTRTEDAVTLIVENERFLIYEVDINGIVFSYEIFNPVIDGAAVPSMKQVLPPLLEALYTQSPLLFTQNKVLAKLPPNIIPDTLLTSISAFLSSDSYYNQRPTWFELESFLIPWSNLMMDFDFAIEDCWTVVDLLRTAMANSYVSSWFLEHGMESVKKIVCCLSKEPRYELHVVTTRLAIHKFDFRRD